jgi:hypothetical protein
MRYLKGLLLKSWLTAGVLMLASGLGFAQPKISFGEIGHEFGNVAEQGGLATYTFTFTNTGTEPLLVSQATASCGCTTPQWTREAIAPGKSGTVTVSYDPSGRPGPFHKTITVLSNAGEATILNIKGVVVQGPPANPEYVQYFPYNKKAILLNDERFGTFANELVKAYKAAGTLQLQLESSASQVPTERYKKNELLTRTRAAEARAKLLLQLASRGVDKDKVSFAPDRTLVQGPVYNKDFETNRRNYEKYQYIKIILLPNP